MLKRLTKHLILLGFLAGTAASFIPTSVFAVGPQGPDNSGTFPTTADHQRPTYHIVSRTSFVVIDDTYVKVYYPNANAQTITIVSGHNCTAHDPLYDDYGSGVSGSIDTQFFLHRTVPNAAGLTEVQSTLLDTANGLKVTGGCPNLTLSIPAGALVYSPYSQAYVALIHADKYGTSNGQNSFLFSAPGGTVGLVGKQDARNVGYEIIGRFDSDGDGYTYIDHNLKFAPDCTLTAPGWQSIRFYDADNGVAGIQPTPFYYRIIDRTTNSFLTAGEYRNPVNTSGSAAGWYPGSVSNSYSTLEIYMEPGHRYEWAIYNVHDNNTFQIEQPYDSYYYVNPCFPATMTPVVEAYVNGVAGTTAEVGDLIEFRYRVNNDSATVPATTSYSGRAYRTDTGANLPPTPWSGGGTPAAPTFNIPANSFSYTTNAARGGNAAHTYSAIADLAVHGPRICGILTINPRNTVEFPPVAESNAPVCIKIGKRPLFRANGGDVWAGGTFGTIGSCPVQTPKPVLRGVTKDYGAGAIFGSLVEYGAFSLGAIQNFGSDRTPFSTSAVSPSQDLMFANNPTLGDFYSGPPGDIGRCLTDVFALYTPGLPTTANTVIDINTATSQVTTAGGTVTINGGALGSNRRVFIYATNADVVRIAGNITFSDGPHPTHREIPQLVILTDGDLVVDPSVTRVDAIIGVKGVGYTCVPLANIPARNNPDAFIRMDTPCGSQVTFNGTVIANDLRLYRTYGASTVGGLLNRGAPGELFNLRGELFLAEYGRATMNNNQARTIYQKELPPRY